MTEQLQRISVEHRDAAPPTYDDLNALLLNCTLTRSPNLSHTEGLIGIAKDILETNGVAVEYLRPDAVDVATP